MNKTKLLSTIVAASSIFISSCGSGLLPALSRSNEDPAVEAPVAVCFETERQISVSWTADPRADYAILERAPDLSSLVFETVYQGTETHYVDANVIDQGRYFYRLTMVRGSQLFGPSSPVFAVTSDKRNDASEPNDDEGRAALLEYDLEANLSYYVSYSGAVLADVDWYAVEIPPRRKARVIVNQTTGLSGSDTDTFFYQYQPGASPSKIVNNVALELCNYQFETKKMLLRITADPLKFLASTGYGGGMFLNYVITLDSITSL